MYFRRKRYILLFTFILGSSTGISWGTPQRREIRLTQCNGRTMNTTYALSQQTGVKSVIDCGTKCLTDAVCMSVTYNSAKRQCNLFPTRQDPLNCGSLEEESGSIFVNMDNPCQFGGLFEDRGCICRIGFSGERCENPPKDCLHNSTIYEAIIYPDGEGVAVPVVCNRLRVRILNVPMTCEQDFNSDWATFKERFGLNANGYWAGTKWINAITNSARYVLYVYLFTSSSYSTEYYYDNFVIDNEDNFFTLHYSSYNKTGLADNFLINGAQFRTHDHNNNGCPTTHNAGFWYEPGCPYAPPTLGTFSRGGPVETVYAFYMELIRMDP